MKQTTFKGIIAYPVTPYNENDLSVNLEVLSTVIDNLIDTKVGAIAALGSAGESAYLTEIEWQDVAEHTVKYVSDRVPVIIGISELTTSKAIERARFAESVNADAVMISPMSYYSLNENEIFQHYDSIAKAINIPIMLYNNPATSGIDMSPEFMLRMVDRIENITMIKESTGDIQRMHLIYSLSGGKVPFYNGCNYMALEALNAGASGWCTAAPCLIGDKPRQLFDAIQNGEAMKAREQFYEQREFLEFIVKNGLAASVKAGLSMQGLDSGTARKPLLGLSGKLEKKLKSLMDELI